MESDRTGLSDDDLGWLRLLAMRGWVNALELASADPEVLAFRKHELGGKLISRGKVLSWAAAVTMKEGATTLTREVFSGSTALRGFRPEVVTETETLTLQLVRGEPIPIRADGTLGKLSAIAHRLADRFGWHVAQTAEWILTGRGQTELADWGYWEIEGGPDWARVVIRAPIELPASYVAELHRDARLRAANDHPTLTLKGGPVGEKQLNVMAFCAQRNDGRSWESMLEEWNEKRCGEHPDWQYTSFRNFSRDVRDSYQRVMGRPWNHGGRSGGDDAEA